MKTIVILCLFTFSSVTPNCLWNVNEDLAEKDPLFLKKSKKNYNLYLPKTPNIELKPNEALIATCPGKGNSLSGFGQSKIKLNCVVGKNVNIDGDIMDIKNISCTKIVAADVVNTSYSEGINILNVGFHTEFGWMNLYNTSYDYNLNTPLYSQHIIHGKVLRGAYTGNASRPGFKVNGVSSKISWNKIYTKKHQQDIIAGILGVDKAKEYLHTTFLSRGHLAPDADFHFRAWELATYFYANAVPQWQIINGGNWLRVENAIRHKAIEIASDLLVITGGTGVMTLENNKLYLEDQENVPVPKYIYKIVCANSSCIALVVYNNPFENDNSEFCQNICSRDYNIARWYLSSYDDVKKGKVICCDVRELKDRQGFTDILDDVPVHSILKY